MYHCVYETTTNESGFQNPEAARYKISSFEFEKQIKGIVGYYKQKLLSIDNIIITFDDGGISFASIIAPILEKYGIKGYFFISTKYINTKGFLTEADILDLHNRGHVIGSHSHSHPKNMGQLSDNDLYDEWNKSVEILTRIISTPIATASIPGGSYSRKLLKIAQKCGIQTMYTSTPKLSITRKDCMNVIGRFSVQNNMNSDDIISIIGSKYTRLIIYNKYLLLKLLRILLGNYYFKIRLIVLKK